ncbi:MAG: hypothetical protein WKG06_22620 [Segetibacter sp.]
MSTAEIREKLYNYIRVADDKKINAIYTLLEDEITENFEWWKDKAILQDFDKRYDDYKSSSSKAYSLVEVEASIEELKQRRQAK